ncbi:MAG TPA: MotA/TolQ/ExbB proton channel family protein [Syntrophorhabdaceae bacterium]|nr:MotA/TolQ/ExbB proton channel family protein [Syntrophorhabdaceae bacterium]
MAKVVASILFLFSLISWTIIFKKWRQLNEAYRWSDLFLKTMKGNNPRIVPLPGEMEDEKNPFSSLFSVARQEALVRGGENKTMTVETIMAIRGLMQAVGAEQIARLEDRLTFLATTANTAPFIGLFGTVWGIMDSFREIGAKGTTSLAVVAPGISQALIATAIGLATAIPAVLAYNYFMGRVKGIASKIENGSIYLLNYLTR